MLFHCSGIGICRSIWLEKMHCLHSYLHPWSRRKSNMRL